MSITNTLILILCLCLGTQNQAHGQNDYSELPTFTPIAIAAADADGQQLADGTTDDTDQYPRVTAMEEAVLGKTFVNDELSVRMSRLETKAFGKPSTKDLIDRTDAMQDYVENKLHKQIFKVDPGYEDASDDNSVRQMPQTGSTDDSPGGDGTQNGYVDQNSSAAHEQDSTNGDYPHITDLETAILKKSYAGEPVEDRLGRLESTAFGTASKDPDLSSRIDALDNYAEKKLHIKPHQQLEREADQAGVGATGGGDGGPAPSRLRQVGTMVGTSLINMAGMGIPGAMGMGMGPMRVRNRADLPPEEQKQMQQPNAPVEDPVIYEKAPPPDNAKLLTKVAWCEVQVFGHTFPTLHLPQRLAQLNSEMNFAPGKTGIALMDSTASMIKAAQNHKAGQAVGAPGSTDGN